MSSTVFENRRTTRAAVVALVLTLAAVAWIVRPQTAESVAPAAIPNSERIGTLTFSGSPAQTLDVRSFSFGATATPCHSGGGGCSGKPTLSDPAVQLDSGPMSPQQFETLINGSHIQRLTLVLFKPFTVKRSQEYVFDEAILTSIQTSKGAPNNGEPQESLTWAFKKVTYRTYNPGTDTVLSETCYDVVQVQQC